MTEKHYKIILKSLLLSPKNFNLAKCNKHSSSLQHKFHYLKAVVCQVFNNKVTSKPHLKNETWFSLEKEWSTNMDEPWNIMLNKRSQTQKVTYCYISRVGKHRDRKQIGCCLLLWKGKNREWQLNGCRIFSWSDENVLEHNIGGSCKNAVKVIYATKSYTLKCFNFMLREFRIN